MPAHGLHATVTVKCMESSAIVSVMTTSPGVKNIPSTALTPRLQNGGQFDPSSCNVKTAAGQAFNPKAPRNGGGKGPGDGSSGGGKGPSDGSSGGGNSGSGGGGGDSGGGGSQSPGGGGGGAGGNTPGGGGGGSSPPRGGSGGGSGGGGSGGGGSGGGGSGGGGSGGGRRQLLTTTKTENQKTSSSLNYCTVTINYAQGICGYQRNNLTSTILDKEELFPTENTDGDENWTFTLDATGIDYPSTVEVPMCSSSDSSDYVQIDGISDNRTKIAIVNQIVYRNHKNKFFPMSWVKKNKPGLFSEYNPGEFEVRPRAQVAQIVTLTRYNLTYYPKYLSNATNSGGEDWHENDAISRIIWFGNQRDDWTSRTAGGFPSETTNKATDNAKSNDNKPSSRCSSTEGVESRAGQPYTIKLKVRTFCC